MWTFSALNYCTLLCRGPDCTEVQEWSESYQINETAGIEVLCLTSHCLTKHTVRVFHSIVLKRKVLWTILKGASGQYWTHFSKSFAKLLILMTPTDIKWAAVGIQLLVLVLRSFLYYFGASIDNWILHCVLHCIYFVQQLRDQLHVVYRNIKMTI